ncbi:transporter, NhaC family [Dethiosulfatibacter aminovorans DSM 17477]|uniref:Transporter, NhaC family n=1 Tax=Dethiosulfatibacter aminovorans DSM 17477 TaxID=1121476 RepID=A0A1M6AST1_9FIRM|nr:Na+/H+ antiporter NhaC [Dethiosulfatibacter aminovorans]SHI39526.1 transporter, NhaC family [Dethiosulfatibacter aminovorans DSM 17477]
MKKKPTFGQALSCIVFMFAAIGIGKGIFKFGIQQLLLLSAAYAAVLGKRLGYSYQEMEEGISEKLKQSMPTMYIIMTVGIVVGTWIYSGTVPMMIYYGLKLISPSLFLVTAFIIVGIVSTATGTAWGSTATAGVALMGVASQMGIPLGMAAGAIIAGGVFGDKMSPLSDTTNLAPMVSGAELFEHIRHMFYTTIPAAIISLVVYFAVGSRFAGMEAGNSESVGLLMANLDAMYNWSILLMLPVAIILVGSMKKMPTVPLMLLSSVVAVILGATIHGFALGDGVSAMVSGFNVNMVAAKGLNPDTIIAPVLKLANRGGIKSMMNIVITIICGYSFAGIIEKIGCLEAIMELFSAKISKVWQLIGVTIIGSLVMVFTAGVASVAFIMIGTLLKDTYKKMGLHAKNLSRTLEDSATMWLPFVPWGASGIFYMEVLGVDVAHYGIWAISCYLGIVMSMFCAFTGFGIARIGKDAEANKGKALETALTND